MSHIIYATCKFNKNGLSLKSLVIVRSAKYQQDADQDDINARFTRHIPMRGRVIGDCELQKNPRRHTLAVVQPSISVPIALSGLA